MLQKLLHKKWMVVCLLIGNILLIAIACSNPMYKNAALQRTLAKQFADHIKSEGICPHYLMLESSIVAGNTPAEDYLKMDELSDNIMSDLGFEETDDVQVFSTVKSSSKSIIGREDNKKAHSLKIASMTGLEDHVEILSGKMYDSKPTSDGAYEAIVSQTMFLQNNFILNEEVEFNKFKDKDGKKIVVKIVGVFVNSRQADDYWIKSPSEYDIECFIDENVFKEHFVNTEKPAMSIDSTWYLFFDYNKLEPSRIDSIVKKTNRYMEEYDNKAARVDGSAYLTVLNDFLVSQKKTVSTLLILQVPVLVLLCAFIFMISRQMLDLEQNEISLLKSRGSSRGQIIMIYLLQSGILAVVSALIGLPLGSFLCRVLGSANGFLEFVQRSSLNVHIDSQVILYCLGAMLVSAVVMTAPVIRDSKLSIVNLKQSKNKRTRSIWSRFYPDVILLALSIYGLYSFNDRKESIMINMLSGSYVDPLLFACASLFIISAGLVALRLQPLIVRLIYLIGKKFFPPSLFASFLNIIRSKGKQSFMMIFLILTVALGIYNSTVARTILSNANNSIDYSNGADIVFQEVWKDNSAFLVPTASYEVPKGLKLVYTEPDIKRFADIDEVESVARVMMGKATFDKKTRDEAPNETDVMAINTKEFGETINFDSGLLPQHINVYLNALSKRNDAVLLSMNYHSKQGYKVGETFTYVNEDGYIIDSIIYGFVEYWPSYIPESYVVNEEGVLDKTDRYLVIANLANVQSVWGVTPYQVWMKTKGSTSFIYDYAEQNNIKFTMFKDSMADKVNIRNNALFQGTNGILTMSFFVVLILCSVGFLIYWILSIRKRELLFGVLRAMGMKKSQIIIMLINEQIFSSGLSIGIGAVIGVVSANLFVPLIQIFYSTTEQTIPLEVVRESADLVRLFGVIGVVICVCMVVLGILISRIRISQALKLGED